MKKTIILLIFLIFFASSSYYVALTPQTLTPLTHYTTLSVNDLSLIYIALMVVLTIIFSYLLIHSVIDSIKKFI